MQKPMKGSVQKVVHEHVIFARTLFTLMANGTKIRNKIRS